MPQLAELITAQSLLDIETTEHHSALQQLIDHALPGAGEDLRYHVFEEIRSSSGKEINLGKGFALSHMRTDTVSQISLAVGLFGRKVAYIKGEPVHTVFCMIIPSNQGSAYLALLAQLSQFLLRPGTDSVFLLRSHSSILSSVKEIS